MEVKENKAQIENGKEQLIKVFKCCVNINDNKIDLRSKYFRCYCSINEYTVENIIDCITDLIKEYSQRIQQLSKTINCNIINIDFQQTVHNILAKIGLNYPEYFELLDKSIKEKLPELTKPAAKKEKNEK